MTVRFRVVVPARFASTRLPGKPLVEIAGRPMIVHVVERALQSGARDVVVATDDTRVAEAVAAAGHQAALTRTDHPSGSDRVMEVVQQRGWLDDDIVINVQGDEPLIPPALIAQTAGLLEGAADAAVATLCEPLQSRRLLFDPNVVKVIAGQHGLALYFSRAPIPYARDEFSQRPPEDDALPARPVWFRHIGIYGFRVRALARFVALPPSPLEQTEMLEQLRMLDNGMAIRVAQALQAAPGGVDTPEDLARVREIIRATSA